MSPVISAEPDADAEARVKEIIARCGGGQALMQSMAAYREVASRMSREAPALVKSHPNQWAALAPGTELVLGDSLGEVLAEVASRTGGDLTSVVTEYLDPDPPVLIL